MSAPRAGAVRDGPVRVAIDVSIQELEEGTGVERAQAVLLDGLLATDAALEFVLLARRRVPERWRHDSRVTCAEGSAGPLWLWRETVVPRVLREERIDLLHSPVAALPLRARCPLIATIHEVPWGEDGDADGDDRASHRLRLHLAANFAARLLVPSERTAAAVRSVHPDAERLLRVVPHGVAPCFLAPVDGARRATVAARWGATPGRFVLAVGRLRAKKNVALLLEAFARLLADGAAASLPERLVLVGPDGDARGSLDARAARPDLAGRVVFAGYVDDAELAALYAGAAAVAFPSRLEGFGLPVLEAMAAGVPVLVSAEGAVPEVTGGLAHVLPGDDVAAWAAALRQACAGGAGGDESAASDARRRHARDFSAERAARAVLDVYAELR